MKRIATLIALIFCVHVNAQFITILNFNGANGSGPSASLISDGNFLYGMSQYGGANDSGVIFKIKTDGTGYTDLMDFGKLNGCYPYGSLYSDGTFLYGMAKSGGTAGYGTIFKIKPDGTGFIKLLDFTGMNGGGPFGSLISDGTFLYGMTCVGGTAGYGTVFKIKPDGTAYAKILDFEATPASGSNPASSLYYDGTFLYGTTQFGGAYSQGTVFKIKPDGTGYEDMKDFTGGADGSNSNGFLISDGTFLYGMTTYGGANADGTIFKIKPDGTDFEKLFDFAGTSNGKFPYASLISDGTYLYGMTGGGGANNGGTAFRIKPDGTSYLKLLDFGGKINGKFPYGTLFMDSTILYGMTNQGGTSNTGTIFKFNIGCINADTVANAVVGGLVTAEHDTICRGTSGNFTLSGNSNNIIQWQSSVDDNIFANDLNDTLIHYKTPPLFQNTWYRVLVGSGNCTAFSDTLELYVPPVLKASFYFISTGDKQLTFNADSSTGNIRSYHWDFGDGQTSTERNPEHTFAKDTTYYVCLTVYDGSNCSYTTCKNSSIADGIPTISTGGNWVVYPTPFTDQLTITEKQANNHIQGIEMYDMLGHRVINKNSDSTTNTYLRLDGSLLAKGMYYVIIITADAQYAQKVVKL